MLNLRILFLLSLMIFTLPACSQAGAPASTLAPEFQVTASPPNRADFLEVSPETYVMLKPAVIEYLYYRKQAVLTGDIETFWAHYPDLKIGRDPSKGVNAEAEFVANMHLLPPLDGNTLAEISQPMRVKRLDASNAEVLLQWVELYLYIDKFGDFEESGGVFDVILSLRYQDGRWLVVKTWDISGP